MCVCDIVVHLLLNNKKQLDKSHTHQFGLSMDTTDLKQWCGQELTKLLRFTVGDELVR